MAKKIKVGVLFGGRSGEHEVSLQSAASIMKALDTRRYDITPIAITREGRWLMGPALEANAPLALAEVLKRGKPVIAPPDPGGPQLIPLDSGPQNQPSPVGRVGHIGRAGRTGRIGRLDVIFPVLHGTFGEDGTVQGLLELAGIAYVGAGVLGSAVGMDKDVMKRLFRDAGLPVVRWEVVRRSAWEREPARVSKLLERSLGYPAFVKPANLGSSVGITKVHSRRELEPALNLASQYDTKMVVETAVDAREIECAVLGNDCPEASLPGEVIPINEFYDYDAKYVSEGSQLVIPARLRARQTKRVRELAIRAFKATDGAGMARIDFLMERGTGTLYVNEINTIPGFTSISMYPKLWEATGLSYPKLLDRLIELALERSRETSRNRYTAP
jgi:D-alanine-D-alanine ligase